MRCLCLDQNDNICLKLSFEYMKSFRYTSINELMNHTSSNMRSVLLSWALSSGFIKLKLTFELFEFKRAYCPPNMMSYFELEGYNVHKMRHLVQAVACDCSTQCQKSSLWGGSLTSRKIYLTVSRKWLTQILINK